MKNSLFRIVGRITEEVGEYPSCDPISTLHNDAILVCMHKLIIKQKCPDSLDKLALTMSIDII
jgi:hypothetical protein